MSKDSNGQSAAEQSGAAPKVFRRGCIIIPNALHHMVHDAGLKNADWGTLAALLNLCRYGTRQCYASNAWIGEACGLSKSAVGRSLSRLAKSGLIERRYDQGDHCWGIRLLFDPRSLVAKEGQRDWTLAVAEQLAVDEADETKSHRLDVFEGKESARVAATTILERCEELAIGSYWFSDTAIRTIFLYRGCDGRFFERAIDIDSTTLEIRDDRCYLVTDEQAAERYKRAPEKAPEYLRPLVAKFDLTAAVPPDGISQRDKPMSINSNGRAADAPIADPRGSLGSPPGESSLFQAPSWEGMFEIIEAVADLTEAVDGFSAEIALEYPTGMTKELAIYLLNLLRAAIRLRDMFGPLADMQRPPPVGWPPAVRVQLDILHNRVDDLWTGLELNKAPSEALDSYRKGHDHSAIQIRPDWTGHEVVYASILKAALKLYLEVRHLARKATAATESAPPAYRPDAMDAMALVLPNEMKAMLTSCRELSLARRTAAATSENGTAASEAPAQRPELAAAPPSGNATAATNSRTSEALADRNCIDFDALAETLLRSGKVLTSKLVKFMKNRSTATFQEVMDGVHGGERSSEAIRTLVNRTNNALHCLESRLTFSTKDEQVIRDIAPE